MKSTAYLLLMALFLIGCDSGENTAPPAPEAAPEEPSAVGTDSNADLTPIMSDEARVATARMAAPEASRGGARVIGYGTDGELVTLAEGTNEFICLADDPTKEGFSAACYHQSLEPFMARGRALKAEGMTPPDIDATREAEVTDGTLKMGDMGSTLHVLSGPDAQYDAATGTVPGATYRYVVYVPFATAASTGLPESPVAPNHPWIMDPGTHRAHIMISPVAGE